MRNLSSFKWNALGSMKAGSLLLWYQQLSETKSKTEGASLRPAAYITTVPVLVRSLFYSVLEAKFTVLSQLSPPLCFLFSSFGKQKPKHAAPYLVDDNLDVQNSLTDLPPAPAASTQSSGTIMANLDYTSTPIETTISRPSHPLFDHPLFDHEICHVCEKMAERKIWKQKGPASECYLCARFYCAAHKGKETNVCEINHRTYYYNHPRLQTVAEGELKEFQIFLSLADRKVQLGR
ncbi:hypothetical protein VTL71DRAFT_16478 [Oculimacula yallundae]|uniref:Uncharacterized protein n=1 Tax=Oculimacula yallundae TaxID=86028 RepID=A0ABR4CF59_9HELO